MSNTIPKSRPYIFHACISYISEVHAREKCGLLFKRLPYYQKSY